MTETVRVKVARAICSAMGDDWGREGPGDVLIEAYGPLADAAISAYLSATGGEVVAWRLVDDDGDHWWGPTASKEELDETIAKGGCADLVVQPLYASPPAPADDRMKVAVEALEIAAEDLRTIKTLNSHGASDQTYIGWLRSNASSGEGRVRAALASIRAQEG